MTVSPSIPATVEMRASRFAGIVVLVAAVAAAITWALVTYVVNTGSDSVQASTRTPSSSELALGYENALGAPAGMQVVPDDPALDYENALGAPGQTHVAQLRTRSSKYVDGITSLGLVEQAAAFGGPGGVVDALQLDPASKKYVKAIDALTNEQIAAGYGR